MPALAAESQSYPSDCFQLLDDRQRALAADQRSLWLLELGPEAAPAPVENRSTNGVAPRF